MSEMPLESATEDVVDQRSEAYEGGARTVRPAESPLEADPADARDQADEVPLDDEDY